MISDKDKYRYDRQIKLKEIGVNGQFKIQNTAVLVVGAGGLGCSVLQLLAGSGIGKIGIADFDSINITNLHRQTIFTEKMIGENKAFAAGAFIKRLNSTIEIEIYTSKITGLNAIAIFKNYDIIIDASDNFSTRYLINDVCVLLNKPFVFGAVYQWEGQVAVFNYQDGPTYRCAYPEVNNNNLNCELVGVVATICMEIATRQVNEVFKIILETGKSINKGMLYLDLLANQSYLFNIDRNQKIIEENYKTEEEIKQFNYEFACGESSDRDFILIDEFLEKINNQEVQILDIRQMWEGEPLSFKNTIQIPMQHIDSIISTLDKNKIHVVVCTYGTRSTVITDYLKLKHQFNFVYSLKGGVQALENSQTT